MPRRHGAAHPAALDREGRRRGRRRERPGRLAGCDAIEDDTQHSARGVLGRPHERVEADPHERGAASTLGSCLRVLIATTRIRIAARGRCAGAEVRRRRGEIFRRCRRRRSCAYCSPRCSRRSVPASRRSPDERAVDAGRPRPRRPTLRREARDREGARARDVTVNAPAARVALVRDGEEVRVRRVEVHRADHEVGLLHRRGCGEAASRPRAAADRRSEQQRRGARASASTR